MKKTVAILVILISLICCVFAATWTKKDVLDVFGDPTGEFVVESGTFSGTYKNQSTTDGKLTYSISVTKAGKMTISLMESGAARDLTTTSGGAWMVNSNEVYKVQIKYDDGSVYSYNGLISRNSDYKYRDIFIGYINNSVKISIDMRADLIANKALKIVITGSNGSYSLGSVDTSTITDTTFFDRTLYDEGLRLQGQGKHQEALEKFNELKSTDKESYDYYQVVRNMSESKRNLGLIEVGDIGPAGGIIFYDCDADNETGNRDGLKSSECGWRYLEAAPADLRVVNGVPTVDSNAAGYASADDGYAFGYYRVNSDGYNLNVNGSTKYNEKNCTGTAIGSGERNTELLVNAMGSSAYSYGSGSDRTDEYAAKLCSDLVYNGFDDWFLPSREELYLMFESLGKVRLGGFADSNYWSSSEHGVYADSAVYLSFYNGLGNSDTRRYKYRVRAVRAF